MGYKADTYRQILMSLDQWDEYLLEESGLPGKRANLELLESVVELGNEELFRRYSGIPFEESPTGSRAEFLVMCGVVGLGKIAARTSPVNLGELRAFASDRRWRIREAVAMGLQYFGRSDMDALIDEMDGWATGSFLEQRAAAAGLCEPDLLTNPKHVLRVFRILDCIMGSVINSPDRKAEDFRVLRKALGYCWSVAVAALPGEGKRAMDKWLGHDDGDVRWIMKQNLAKKRLVAIYPGYH